MRKIFKYYVYTLILLYIFNSSSYASSLVLSNFPEYYWWYGCSPTSSGMIVGYWDTKGYDMIPGDALTTSGDKTSYMAAAGQPVRDIIASQDHIDEVAHANDSLADFMNTTVAGGSTSSNAIGPGMVAFAAWDNPNTAINDSYAFSSVTDYTSEFWGPGTFDFQDVIDEIDAGRPIHLGTILHDGGGHSVVAYGYEDNTGTDDDWFAVRDTWSPGITDAYSAGAGANDVSRPTDHSHEWWHWQTDTSGGFHVYGGRTFVPEAAPPGAPEPGSIILFGFGVLGLLRRKRNTNDDCQE